MAQQAQKILKAHGILPVTRRASKPRYVVVARFEDGVEATRTTWTTLAEARQAARSGANLGSADLCRIGHEDVALECYEAGGRVVR